MTKRRIDLSIMPLNDCAPLVAAFELGLFAAAGLDVQLSRQSSWATSRDLLNIGAIDGAQMLAPATLVTPLAQYDLRLNQPPPIVSPLVLNLCGNSIVVSTAIKGRLNKLAQDAFNDPMVAARTLVEISRENISRTGTGLRFGVVHGHSSHFMDLCRLIEAGGGNPAQDLSIAIVPPQEAEAFLRQGLIDGFSAGEPWGSLATARGEGAILVTAHDLWPNRIEKILSLNTAKLGGDEGLMQAIIQPIIQAAAWLDIPDNRAKMAGILVDGGYLPVPLDIVKAGLCGDLARIANKSGTKREPDFVVFHRYLAGMPWHSQGRWMAQNLIRHRQMPALPFKDLNAALEKFWPNQPYVDACRALNLPSLSQSNLVDAEGHSTVWPLMTENGTIEMGPNKRFED